MLIKQMKFDSGETHPRFWAPLNYLPTIAFESVWDYELETAEMTRHWHEVDSYPRHREWIFAKRLDNGTVIEISKNSFGPHALLTTYHALDTNDEGIVFNGGGYHRDFSNVYDAFYAGDLIAIAGKGMDYDVVAGERFDEVFPFPERLYHRMTETAPVQYAGERNVMAAMDLLRRYRDHRAPDARQYQESEDFWHLYDELKNEEPSYGTAQYRIDMALGGPPVLLTVSRHSELITDAYMSYCPWWNREWVRYAGNAKHDAELLMLTLEVFS